MNEEKLLQRIVVNPKIMLGKPVIKGSRLTIELIVEKIAFGATLRTLKKDYPFIVKDDVHAALLYAAKRLSHEEVYALDADGEDQGSGECGTMNPSDGVSRGKRMSIPKSGTDAQK